jgi:hypothetical protein
MLKEKPLMTKACIAPWEMLEVGVDGGIRPCCGPVEGDFGNINSVLSNPAMFRDALNSEAHKQLRRQLLTGELEDACATCRIAPNKPITIEALRRNVVVYLQNRGRNISEHTDLCSEFAFEACNAGVTDKCNFSCIYCFTHSNDKTGEGIRKYTAISHERLLQLTSLLVENGLKVLAIGNVGELTIYPSWRDLCTTLFDNYPNLYVTLVSNFGRKFSDADLDVLVRFHRIAISCDTIDPELYSWLRRGGRIDVLLNNISRLKSRMCNTTGHKPSLVLNVTESNVIIDKLVDLAKYAVDNEIDLQFSNLLVVKGSFAEKNKCLTKITDIPDDQVPSAWEVIGDLRERMVVQNPRVRLDFGPLYDILKQRAEAISLNRFVPSANELFYRSFACAHPRNPNAILRKIFRSFYDCYRGILITSGSTIAIKLPYLAARLKYRTIWCKNNHSDMYIGAMEEASVGSYLSIATARTKRYFTHVLMEVFEYEIEIGSAEIDETLILSEPGHDLDAHSKEISKWNPEGLSAEVASIYIRMGKELLDAMDYLGAGEAFHRALLLNPRQAEAHLHLGNLHLVQGQAREAATVFRDALHIVPQHEGLALALGQALDLL